MGSFIVRYTGELGEHTGKGKYKGFGRCVGTIDLTRITTR